MEGQQSGGIKKSTADKIALVRNLLAQIQARLQKMSELIVVKDQMESRIDALEGSINSLKSKMELMGTASSKTDEAKPAESA